jgi:tRNA(fMet)-specific endonuclease VapC
MDSWERDLACGIVDNAAAKRAAEVSSVLGRTGMGIGPMDNLIAGTALAHGATLVTHNTAEFRRVKGLNLTDWY